MATRAEPIAKAAPRVPEVARLKVARGRLFFENEIDPTAPIAIRFHELVRQHVSDLGGSKEVSVSQMQLLRHASMLETQLEILEAKMLQSNDEVSVEEYARVSSHCRRHYETLGVKRVSRDVTPDLHSYVKTAYNEPA